MSTETDSEKTEQPKLDPTEETEIRKSMEDASKELGIKMEDLPDDIKLVILTLRNIVTDQMKISMDKIHEHLKVLSDSYNKTNESYRTHAESMENLMLDHNIVQSVLIKLMISSNMTTNEKFVAMVKEEEAKRVAQIEAKMKEREGQGQQPASPAPAPEESKPGE
jgi:hypothetical protein